MKTVTTSVILPAFLVAIGMNSAVLQADELQTHTSIVVVNEANSSWTHGRDGLLEIHGSLLSSPCTLRTNTLALPLQRQEPANNSQPSLSLDLAGCGYGDDLTSASMDTTSAPVIVTYDILRPGPLEGAFVTKKPAQIVVHGGSVRLTWHLSEGQLQELRQPVHTPLRLSLAYE